MPSNRITQHPILKIPDRTEITFQWNGRILNGYDGEMISSALVANGVHIFGHHAKDGSPQGLFCANGQCSQCLVLADGIPVKACMTPLQQGLVLASVEGLAQLPVDDSLPGFQPAPVKDVTVLIIGAGPAGLAAALELGRLGVDTLLVDDKDRLGGKLVLQTHKFFGSVEDSYAGTRGFAIARILAEDLQQQACVQVWLNSTAVGVFSDGIVGVVQHDRYRLVRPAKLLVATGAREKMLSFPGNTLPGVYGAGAFQTLVNRDLIKSSDRLLIVGGGNVGLIAGYHAIQAGMRVVALIEALPQVGGYKVHADKLKRLGVPIHTRHTVTAARGSACVESVTIARLDADWKVISGSHQTLAVDTVLIAVGLAEVDEFYHKARAWGMDAYAAGDAREIAEASAAMFAGKIEGLKIAKALGCFSGDIPAEWTAKAEILKSRPGPIVTRPQPAIETGVVPIFHCDQEVPCNPCTSVCPENAIRTERDDILGLPYMVDYAKCQGCLSCVAICPGLALTVVDYRKDPRRPRVTLPYEIERARVVKGQKIAVADKDGAILGYYPVQRVIANAKKHPGTLLVQVQMEKARAPYAAGIWIQEPRVEPTLIYEKELPSDDAIVCRCERISAGEIRRAIRAGVRDINQLKALTRAAMGACGSKTCRTMIWRLFQEEGIDAGEVTDRVDRPLFVEVPMGVLAGAATPTQNGDKGHA